MATEDKSAFSSLSSQDQRGTDRLQNNQMEDTIKHLRDRGYKVTEEYSNTGQLSKVSGEYPPRKTWWDWLQLLIIPLVLLGIGSWFSYQQNQASLQVSERQHQSDLNQRQIESDIAIDQQRATTLTTTMDDIRDLLLNKGLRVSKPEDEVRVVARAEVLSSLRRLDGERKGLLIQFLSEAGLVTSSGNDVIIDLTLADLTSADLKGTDLHGADLKGAHLTGAHLISAILIRANLTGADLTSARLIYAGLYWADLTGANLIGADLHDAHLEGANLTGAQVTSEQLATAWSLKGATMPDGSIHP